MSNGDFSISGFTTKAVDWFNHNNDKTKLEDQQRFVANLHNTPIIGNALNGSASAAQNFDVKQ